MIRRLGLACSAVTFVLAGSTAIEGHAATRARAATSISQACAANNNYVFADHGACVGYFETMTANGFPKSSGYIASYCSLFTYPGYVFDPYSLTDVYEQNQGQCVKYANESYKP